MGAPEGAACVTERRVGCMLGSGCCLPNPSGTLGRSAFQWHEVGGLLRLSTHKIVRWWHPARIRLSTSKICPCFMRQWATEKRLCSSTEGWQ